MDTCCFITTINAAFLNNLFREVLKIPGRFIKTRLIAWARACFWGLLKRPLTWCDLLLSAKIHSNSFTIKVTIKYIRLNIDPTTEPIKAESGPGS